MPYAVKMILSVLFGYLLGTISPSALLGKIKKRDLRSEGTKNLGATNTLVVMGKAYAAIVLIFDIAKGFFAVKIAGWVFPGAAYAGLAAGAAAVFGHVFPFYMKFKGGKGFAAFAGMILGADPLLFAVLFVFAVVLVFAVNYSAAMPTYGAIAFPVCYGIKHTDFIGALIAAIPSILIFIKHFSNIGKAMRGEEFRIRSYAAEHFFKRKKKEK